MSPERRNDAPGRPRRVFARYLCWQAPGWLAAAAIVGVLVVGAGWPWWIVLAAVAVLVARDVALYPAMRATFRPPAPTKPIGRRGVAVEALQPAGLVRVDGELWRARADGDGIPADCEVVVTAARGLALLVKRADAT